MKNKRGISPLISVVLLVAFVIVISVMVMAWIRGGIETQQERVTEKMTTAQECFVTEIAIPPSSQKGVCWTGDKGIKVIVDNEGDNDILGLTIRVFYEDGSADHFEKDLATEPLTPFNRVIVDDLELENGNRTSLQSVEVIPEILEGDCRDSSDKLTAPKTGINAC